MNNTDYKECLAQCPNQPSILEKFTCGAAVIGGRAGAGKILDRLRKIPGAAKDGIQSGGRF
jgi:hypothetical protein